MGSVHDLIVTKSTDFQRDSGQKDAKFHFLGSQPVENFILRMETMLKATNGQNPPIH